ncbi:AAA family ATPase [Pseudomonas aeruginosa]|nr:AAA family ATPase [Pseudomonas aeruginosa]
MLTRLEIDGFKTFENLQIDLAPFTAVVGSNAAGKSNLFDAIQLLSSLAVRDVAEAVKEMRGEPLELFRQTTKSKAKQIRLAAEVLVDPVVRDPWGSEVKLTHTRMRYEVTLERREIRNGIERIQVAHEAVFPIMRKDDRWADAVKPSKGFRSAYLKYARSKPWLTTEVGVEGLRSIFIRMVSKAETGLRALLRLPCCTVLQMQSSLICLHCVKKCGIGDFCNLIPHFCASRSPSLHQIH